MHWSCTLLYSSRPLLMCTYVGLMQPYMYVMFPQGERLQLDRLVNTFSSSGAKFQNLQQVGINWNW